ncbi:ABC transporter ATP-binding protein [Sulfurovum mangrovi]|uniref:ABC transporter ATP-binding protein n=1 Tax=Sulfurovum mangrovi TaxID=2893889 RepID=UPI001E584627|nr:ABC transporter ATP-binding protein [Sulfurovum mangrovi]UFH60204.1 ABC transporter ATP-binding protein [Sulfurovum mangrovi]
MITLENITKTYGEGEAKTQVLKSIDLSINKGEFVAIMGPSGSGKSTLLNILGTLDIPSEGKYGFQGVEIGSLSKDQRALFRREILGFIFQGFNLMKKTSALENVEVPLIYLGMGKEERKKRATEALINVGLQDRMYYDPAQLSGGQQQRVAIARAISTHPEILIADEPTGNLDTQRSHEIMKILELLNQEGITIIMVTHEEEMAAYASRIIYLRDGIIEKDISNVA